jgi:hypothetical protein
MISAIYKTLQLLYPTQQKQGSVVQRNSGITGQGNFNDSSNLDWNLRWGTQRWFPGDINGDGRTDFMRVSLDHTIPGTTNPYFYMLHVATANNNGSLTYSSQVTGWVWSHLINLVFFAHLVEM